MSEQDDKAALTRRFVSEALQNPHNAALLERLPFLGLPDAWLVAGCLFQTVWNLRSGLAPTAHIKDYDLFYFDASDLSEAAEQAVQDRATALFADLPITVEAKNQARVHLWYERWFGFRIHRCNPPATGSSVFWCPAPAWVCNLPTPPALRNPRCTRRTGWKSCTPGCSNPTRPAHIFRCLRQRQKATVSAGHG